MGNDRTARFRRAGAAVGCVREYNPAIHLRLLTPALCNQESHYVIVESKLSVNMGDTGTPGELQSVTISVEHVLVYAVVLIPWTADGPLKAPHHPLIAAVARKSKSGHDPNPADCDRTVCTQLGPPVERKGYILLAAPKRHP